MSTEDKIKAMQEALLTIKRLMPEVEAELSQMGGVGAAPETKRKPTEKILTRFHKTIKR